MSTMYYTREDNEKFEKIMCWIACIFFGLFPIIMFCISSICLTISLSAATSIVPKNCFINSVKYYDTSSCLYAKISILIIEIPMNQPYSIEQCVDDYFYSNNTICYKLLGTVTLENRTLIFQTIVFFILSMTGFLITIGIAMLFFSLVRTVRNLN